MKGLNPCKWLFSVLLILFDTGKDKRQTLPRSYGVKEVDFEADLCCLLLLEQARLNNFGKI